MNFSIIAKSKLPIDFINELNNDFTERNVDKILTGMSEERYTTFRVNYLKSNEVEVEDELVKNGVEFEKVRITESNFNFNAYVIYNKNEKDLSKLKIYEDGKIYVQSISSMIPPIILRPEPGERVLDMAAAPGSKTTQMAAMMNNDGYILANEIDKFRCEKLKYNVEKQGASIVHIINKDGTQLFNNVKSFDKILVDAPCSGEGRFIVSNKKTYEHWSLKMQKELVEIQKKLLSNAINLCKINGTILYSTCALSLAENEKVIDWAINNFNIEIEKININICIEKNTRVKLNDLSQTSKLETNLTNKSEINLTSKLETNLTNKSEINLTSQPETNLISKSETNLTSKLETNLNEEKEFVSYNSWVTKGNKKGLSDEIKKTIKILPNKLLEGFYVAKIKKLRIITAKNKKATDKVTSVAWNSNDEN
jgi:NOL1/NOP2/sun family putative RNA methylase